MNRKNGGFDSSYSSDEVPKKPKKIPKKSSHGRENLKHEKTKLTSSSSFDDEIRRRPKKRSKKAKINSASSGEEDNKRNKDRQKYDIDIYSEDEENNNSHSKNASNKSNASNELAQKHQMQLDSDDNLPSFSSTRIKRDRNEILTHNMQKKSTNSIDASQKDIEKRFKTVGGEINQNNKYSSKNANPPQAKKSGKKEKTTRSENSTPSSLNEDNFDIEYQMSIRSNSQQNWAFPMDYVPEPDDMKQIIHDYHEKYSLDFLLRRIMNNPPSDSANNNS